MSEPLIRYLLRSSAASSATDTELLALCASGADPNAFELLVRRHASAVWRVCRAVAGGHHEAEDAFQATFLALARKIDVLHGGALGAWLHRVAYHAALRAKPRAAVPGLLAWAGDMQSPEPDPLLAAERSDLGRLLHAEMNRLPDSYRMPLVLCYLEGFTQTEVAAALGWPIGTVSTRVNRGLAQLRDRLTKKGYALSAGGVVAALSGTDATAAPGSLVHLVTNFGAGTASAPASITSLAKGALAAMTRTKMKLAVAALVATVTVTAGGMTLALVPMADPPAPPKAAEPAKPVAATPADASFQFTGLPLDVSDIMEATGLNIYKFNVEVPKDKEFQIALREWADKDSPPRERGRWIFQKGDGNGPTTIRISFMPFDGSLRQVLLSNDKEAQMRISCSDCKPSGMGTVVPVLLQDVKLTERTLCTASTSKELQIYGVNHAPLVFVVSNRAGTLPTNYPRSELVIETKKD